jgi:uncharacterized protein YjbJ (UPF0337 family)
MEGSTMNRDEIKGKIGKAKGTAKEKTGEFLDDPEMQAEGQLEHGAGAVREGYGQAKRKVQEGIEDISESARDDEDR